MAISPRRCEICGAWGHRAKACPLKRLNEMQETLGPKTPVNPAKNVTCPTCGALAGFRCVDHTGQVGRMTEAYLCIVLVAVVIAQAIRARSEAREYWRRPLAMLTASTGVGRGFDGLKVSAANGSAAGRRLPPSGLLV